MKLFRYAAAAMALMAIACTQEQEDPTPETPKEEEVQDGYKVLSIEATQAEETKTAYAGDVTFSWSAGDQISVLCNNGSANFWQTFTVTSPSASSTFTATVTGEVNIGAMDGTKVALYPASDSHVYTSSSEISFHIPAERDFRSANGGHKETAIPMFAWGDSNNTFAFANLTGAVKFTFSNIPAATTQVKFVFQNTGGAKFNGLFALGVSSGTAASNVSWPSASTSTSSEKYATFYSDVENGVASFYIPFGTGTIWPSDHFWLYDAATNSTLFPDYKISKNITVTKNRITVLPALDVATHGVEAGLSSNYGINWSEIDAARNTSSDYQAIRTLKATSDAGYLYLYLEVDPTKLTLSNTYDHKLKIYVSSASGSSTYWGSDHYTSISTDGWIVNNGSICFMHWNTGLYDQKLLASGSTWYYEIRVDRSHEKASALLGTPGTVGIGVTIDGQTCDSTGSGEVWGGSSTPIGVIPTAGTPMYQVALTGVATELPTGSVDLDFDFTESNADIANPERGMYKMVEYKFSGGSGDPEANYSLKDKYDAQNTLTLTLFYLFDYVNGGTLSSTATTYIREALQNVRDSGKKAIVRFGYSNVHEENMANDPQLIHQEPTKDQILAHIAQIKPILQDYEDIILVGQAGFIGTYGEWYYTTYFSNFSYDKKEKKWTETRDWSYDSDTDKVTGYGNRKDVLDAIIDAFPSSRQIEMRTPAYKQFYLSPDEVSNWTSLSGFGTDALHRLAFHNDAFLYGGTDLGTFHYDYERAMWQQQAEYLICGGEAPYSSTPITQMEGYNYDNIPAGIYNNHYTYLHHDTAYPSNSSGGSTLMRWWYQNGWIPSIKKMLGYRLYMTDLTISGDSVNSGASLTVNFTLKNSGAARVINARPMKLVLIHNGTATVLKENFGDVRSVPSGSVSGTTVTAGSQDFTATFTLPQAIVAGDQLALWLPDNATGLQSRAEYSIRLANTETIWTSGGYNVFCTFK